MEVKCAFPSCSGDLLLKRPKGQNQDRILVKFQRYYQLFVVQSCWYTRGDLPISGKIESRNTLMGYKRRFSNFWTIFPSLVSHHDRIGFLNFFQLPDLQELFKISNIVENYETGYSWKFSDFKYSNIFLILKFDIFMIFKISKIIKNYWIISIIKIIIIFLKIYKISLISVFLRYSTFSNLFNNSELFQTWQFLIFLNLWLGLSTENLNSGPVFRMWPNFPLSFCRNSASTAALRMALGSFYSYLV